MSGPDAGAAATGGGRRPQPAAALSLFGKVRSQGDFLRINISDPAMPELVRFLEDGNEALHQAGAQLEAEPLRFVFASSASTRLFLGALGPGMDAVGRSFPLAIFASLKGRDLKDAFPLVPKLYQGFLEQAGALIGEAKELTAGQIAERLPRVELPPPSDLPAAELFAREASNERAPDLLRRLFGEAPQGQQYYAFHTFQVACQAARGSHPGRVSIALDCPCGREADSWVWLELARRILQWPLPPPFFWRGGPRPGLVLSVGAPPPSILPFLGAPARGNQRIWPLRTQHPVAIMAARKALSAAQLLAIDSQQSKVEELIASLSRFQGS